MANVEIRELLRKKRIFHYELATFLGIGEYTLSRKLRRELPAEEKQKMIDAIMELSKGA